MRWISALIAFATALSTSQAAPVPASSQRVDDTVALKVFSAISQMENALYTQILDKFSDDDYVDAGFVNADIPKQLLNELVTDEKAHTNFLNDGLKGNPLNGCNFDFGDHLSNVHSALALARLFEEVSTATLQGGSQLISDKSILGAALSIMPTEAQHEFITNFMNGQSGAPHSFGMSLRPEQAMAVISPFMSGCNVGITGNQPLSLSTTQLIPNQPVQFHYTPSGSQPLYCQMMVEGRTEALSQPLEQCSIPLDMIAGPVYMFITNKVDQLPSNVLNQDTTMIEAGPAVVFINGPLTPLNQVLTPDMEIGAGSVQNARTFTYNGGEPDVKVIGVHTIANTQASEAKVVSQPAPARRNMVEDWEDEE